MTIEVRYNKFLFKKLSYKDLNINYLNWFKNKKELRFIEKNNYNSLLDLKNFFKEIKKNDTLIVGVFDNFGKHIANVKFHEIDTKLKSCYLGILIGDKNHRNKRGSRFIIEGSLKYLNFFFKVSTIYLGVNKNNLRAKRAFYKANFRFEKSIGNKLIMKKEYKFYK